MIAPVSASPTLVNSNVLVSMMAEEAPPHFLDVTRA